MHIFDSKFLEQDQDIKESLKKLEKEIVKPSMNGDISVIMVHDFAKMIAKDSYPDTLDIDKLKSNSEYYVSDEFLDIVKDVEWKCYDNKGPGKNPGDDGSLNEPYSIKQDNYQFCNEFQLPARRGDTLKNRRYYYQENFSGLTPQTIEIISEQRKTLFYKIADNLRKYFNHVRWHQYPQNFFWYRGPGAFMGWHTNCMRPGYRIYLVWNDKENESFMKFYDRSTGKTIKKYEPKGWSINYFDLTGPCNDYGIDAQHWHSVHSNANRFSFAFRVWT